MAAVAKAYADRSLQGFQAALDAHTAQLAGDPVVHTHLQVGHKGLRPSASLTTHMYNVSAG